MEVVIEWSIRPSLKPGRLTQWLRNRSAGDGVARHHQRHPERHHRLVGVASRDLLTGRFLNDAQEFNRAVAYEQIKMRRCAALPGR